MDSPTDLDTDDFIATTMRRVADSAVPRPSEPVRPPTWRRRRAAPLLVAAAAAVVVGGVLVALALDGPDTAPDGVPAGTPPATCTLDYSPQPLPTWARSGFTPPDQPVSYVLGDRGDMVAVVWGTHHPLVAPPRSDGTTNKILWVARVGAADGPLDIRSTLAGTGKTVTRTVEPAPGPSGIDLPSPGCWSLDLTWGSHHDHLMLGYAAR